MSRFAWRTPASPAGESALPVVAGDLIRTGENRYPYYRVIAITHDRAWIRDVQHGTDHVVPIDLCQTLPSPELAVVSARTGHE